jgi:hypothetical protein
MVRTTVFALFTFYHPLAGQINRTPRSKSFVIQDLMLIAYVSRTSS